MITNETRFAIEKGIEIPAREIGESKYPFGLMIKGDSFFIPCAEKKDIGRAQSSTNSAAKRHAKKVNSAFRIMTRRVNGGLRVWCVQV